MSILSLIGPFLGNNQNGFRPKRPEDIKSDISSKKIDKTGKWKEHSCNPIITFIDLKKAFDTIHRGKLMKILEVYGILTTIVKAIKDMYTNTGAKVISADSETELFDICMKCT